MKRWLPHPWLSGLLALVWLLLNNSLAPGQIVLAVGVGVALPRCLRGFWPERLALARPRAVARLARILAGDILVANLAVARRVLGRPAALRPTFVTVPLDLDNEFALSLLASLVCLTPGTVSVGLSTASRELRVHVLDCADPEALVAEIKTRFEAPLKEIFGC